jgi:ABC-type phosphate/phosphonate transport system substrate-binding protein
VLLLAVCSLSPGALAAEPSEQLVLFYDPDANHQAIVNIAGWLNSYLTTAASKHRFQPVQDRAAFEKLSAQPAAEYAIVASTYLREVGTTRLRPLLVPSSGGNVHYRKLLVGRAQTSRDLKNANIAATVVVSGSAGTESVLRLLRNLGVQAQGAHVIPVSKDIDALLALSFGQVDAALVTPTSLAVLERINPAAVKSFTTIVETRPILFSPLCAVSRNTTPDEQKKMTAVFTEMGKDENGRKAMHMLGFEQWVPFEPRMLER